MKKFILVLSLILIPVLVFGFTASVSPNTVKAGSRAVFTFTIIPATDVENAIVDLTMPDGFSAPAIPYKLPGYITYSGDAVFYGLSVSNQKVFIGVDSIKAGKVIIVKYGSLYSWNPSVVIPNSPGTVSFTLKFDGETVSLPITIVGR